jgi:hypothetical protein
MTLTPVEEVPESETEHWVCGSKTRKTGRGRIIHSDKQCRGLRRGSHIRAASSVEVERFVECRLCSGEASDSGTNVERRCPKCGKKYANFGNHLRACSAGDDAETDESDERPEWKRLTKKARER